MRYSYEYKKMCVELYRQGKWVETPEGVKEKNFRNMIQIWARTEESCGVNHKRVQRIMNRLALFGKRPKEKYHSYKGDAGKVADNIINRDFSTEKPLQKWTTDVSLFNLPWGKCYISPILDMNTNEIISYNLSTSPNMEQIRDMLNKAFERFPSVQGLVMHSDQGWQYQHAFYRGELQKHGIIQSMSRKGNCYYNNSRIQAKTKWMPPAKFREASMMES